MGHTRVFVDLELTSLFQDLSQSENLVMGGLSVTEATPTSHYDLLLVGLSLSHKMKERILYATL